MTMQLQIVTMDGQAFNGPAQKLFCRTVTGDICILPRHCNYCTAIAIGEARVTDENGNVRRAACNGGLLTVMGNEVTLAPTTFEWAEDIDAERARESLAKAEARLAGELSESDRVVEENRLRRAKVRIAVTTPRA